MTELFSEDPFIVWNKMRHEEVMETARKFVKTAFPSYTITETLTVDLDIKTEPQYTDEVHLLLTDDDGNQREAHIKLSGSTDHPDLGWDIEDVSLVDHTESTESTETEESPDNPVVAAREFIRTTHPSIDIIRTQDVDLNIKTEPNYNHEVQLLVKKGGNEQVATIQIQGSAKHGFEIKDTSITSV